jgi:hypothetical protein
METYQTKTEVYLAIKEFFNAQIPTQLELQLLFNEADV